VADHQRVALRDGALIVGRAPADGYRTSLVHEHLVHEQRCCESDDINVLILPDVGVIIQDLGVCRRREGGRLLRREGDWALAILFSIRPFLVIWDVF
jgi:hypothetical protein